MSEDYTDKPITLERPMRAGKYTLNSKLPRNPVWYGQDENGRNVVLKHSVPEDAGDDRNPDTIGKLLLNLEYVLQSGLDHPNICPVIDFFDDGEYSYLVTPRIGSENLEEKLNRQTNGKSVIASLRDVAEALAYTHTQGIVHLDVKAKNVVLDEGKAILIDFGSALLIGKPHPVSDRMCSGTTTCMAPEYRESNIYEPRTDTFSFSMMAYEALTRQPAYDIPDQENGLPGKDIDYKSPLFMPEKMKILGTAGELIIKGLNLSYKKRPTMNKMAEVITELAARSHLPPNAKPSKPCLVSV